MISIHSLPALNAVLNSLSALFLLLGYFFIRRRQIEKHRMCMLAAFVTSTLFLVSYLFYHYHAGVRHFTGQGWIRPLYFAILISHSFLAVCVVPLALITLYRALRGRFRSHRRIAVWTLPIWLYVSVTGVIVYLLLYP